MLEILISHDLDIDRKRLMIEVDGIQGPVTWRKLYRNERIWQTGNHYGWDTVIGWICMTYDQRGTRQENCTYTRKAAV